MSEITKKIALFFITALLIICFTISNVCFVANAENPDLLNGPIILQNVIARLMINDIQKAVDCYYSEYTDYTPQIEVYSEKSTTRILNLTYDNGNNTYIVTIEVQPYVAAHNVIGIDRITFEISGAGEIKVRDFKHIKSYEYPPWLNVKLKRPFPPDTY